MLPCTHTIPSLSTQVTKDGKALKVKNWFVNLIDMKMEMTNQNGGFADIGVIVGNEVDDADEHHWDAVGHDDYLHLGERGGGDEQL